MTTWTDPAYARRWWKDTDGFSDGELQELLDIAADELLPFAPALPPGDPIPPRYKLACVYQARDIYAVTNRQGDDALVGEGEYAIRPRVLSGAVKQLLRPRGAAPRFGRRKPQ